MSGKSRIEKILENLLGDNNVIEPPIGRDEKILYSILNDLEYTDPPHSIFEDLLLAIKNGSSTETEYAYENLVRDEKILFCKLNRREYFEPPHSRLEQLLIKWLYLDLYLNIDGVPPFTFVSNGSPIIDYTIYGNTVQNGTPTRESPITPQGTGERTGNLFDKTTLENGIYLAANGNKYGDVTNGVRAGVKIKVLPNTAYTLSAQSSVNVSLRIFEWSNGTFTTQTPKYNISGNISLTVTTDAETTEIAFNIEGANGQYVTNIMLNLGSTALPYEPYGYKISISSANTTTPVYLGEVETTRLVKKCVFTGRERWSLNDATGVLYTFSITDFLATNGITCMCSHYSAQNNVSGVAEVQNKHVCFRTSTYNQFYVKDTDFNSTDAIKTYLAQQYAAGTPVTVWYVLATPETGVVNEPLMKIGEYADSISYEQTVVSIPTVSGRNTFDVLGDVKPSNVELTYAPRAPLLGKRKTILKK